MKRIVRRVAPFTELGMHPLLQRVFAGRGVVHTDAITYNLNHLLPYASLKNMDAAVALIHQHLKVQQKILVVGDFDADGATSTALLIRILKRFGAKNVDYLVPNRFDFGYGLSVELVEVAKTMKPALIITVDNGIANHAGVASARAAGIDVLITDHHLAPDTLPDATVIVNPNQPGDTFPSKSLAGVGVIFYVMLALRQYLRAQGWFEEHQLAIPNMAEYLDIVALGTVADVVPLDKNNRIMVYQGLRRIRSGAGNPGIRALLTVGKRDYRKITAQDLGFAVGPRLNAAGRMDDMSHGIACLLTDHESIALQYANDLDQFNQDRKRVEDDMQQQARDALKKLSLSQRLPLGICLFDQQWHQGVIGILAGRIKEKNHRPVIIFAQERDGVIKGSARSIPGVHIRDILVEVDRRAVGLIHKFGGHAMAAGLSLAQVDFLRFRELFNQVLMETVSPAVFESCIETDGALMPEDFCLRTAELLEEAGPWGSCFPEPVFDGVFTVLDQQWLQGKHLKLMLLPEGGQEAVDAIAFNMEAQSWSNGASRVRVVYRPCVNEYQSWRKLQLMVEQVECLA